MRPVKLFVVSTVALAVAACSGVCERAVLHLIGSTYVNFSFEWNVNL